MTTDDTEAEKIIGVATRLFGQLGFDGTSMQLIGDAADVDPPRLAGLVGSKQELYRTVVSRAFEAEQAAVMKEAGGLTATRGCMSRLLDAYLDFYTESPHMVQLWLHRRMGDAADIAGLEEMYIRPPFVQIGDLLRQAAPGDVDVDYVVWTTIWMVSGFLSTGIMHSAPDHPHGPHLHLEQDDVEDFRRYLHEVLHRMLPLPE